jgi:hypothetical protein
MILGMRDEIEFVLRGLTPQEPGGQEGGKKKIEEFLLKPWTQRGHMLHSGLANGTHD